MLINYIQALSGPSEISAKMITCFLTDPRKVCPKKLKPGLGGLLQAKPSETSLTLNYKIERYITFFTLGPEPSISALALPIFMITTSIIFTLTDPSAVLAP